MRPWVLLSLAFVAGCAPAPTNPIREPAPQGDVLVEPQEAPNETGASGAPPERTEPEYDLDAEVAWARRTWPDPLRALNFRSLAPDLVAWVSEDGETQAYLIGTEWEKCTPVVLHRPAAPNASEDTGVESVADTLDARIIGEERTVRGARERTYAVASFGHAFELHDASGRERLDASGEWRPFIGSGSGSPPRHRGVLSYVDDEEARFDGIDVSVRPICDGPQENIRCPDGASQPCDQCRKLEFEIEDVRQYRTMPMPTVRAASGCPKLCRQRVHPDMPRLEALFTNASTWRVLAPEGDAAGKRPGSSVLYRSKERCESARGGE